MTVATSLARQYIAAYKAARVSIVCAAGVAVVAVICVARMFCANRNIIAPLWAELTERVVELVGAVKNCAVLRCS